MRCLEWKNIFFYAFCEELAEHGLKQTKNMGVLEMVAMFLNILGHGIGNRMIQEKFQHSSETASRCFHKILVACLKLLMKLIKPQDPSFKNIHTKIQHDSRHWPYFKDCIGTIDGTHVPCVVPPSEHARFIGIKGYRTQNVMATCDWDMRFTFAWTGWEGRAKDARIFHATLHDEKLNFPHLPSGLIL